VLIDSEDLDYPMIAGAFSRMDSYKRNWRRYEGIYENNIESDSDKKRKHKRRSSRKAPIGRDVVRIIRSIFSTSFLSNPFPISLTEVGEEDSERKRQLLIACKHYWKKSDYYVEINKAFLSMLIYDVGIVSQYWDSVKKRNVLNAENILDVAFDPTASKPSDVEYVCYRYKKTARDIYNRIKSDKELKKELRFYNKANGIDEVFPTYDPKTFEPLLKIELEEIYIRDLSGGWICKTYMKENSIHLRTVAFPDLPFQWGFAIEQVSSVKEEKRQKQIMAYGVSLISFIETHIEEMNRRRNQHDDVIEKQINPDVFIGNGADVKANLLDQGAGTKIPTGDVNQITFRPAPPTFGLESDLSLLKQDIEQSVGVNSILQGQTNSSDRRSQGAIAILNAQSSTRVEEMITTANETLFTHLVRQFVKNIYNNVDSQTLMQLGVTAPIIGCDSGNCGDMDFIVSVDFGSEGKNLEKYADIMEIVRVLGQYQNVNPEEIIKLVSEAVRIKLGEESETYKRLFATSPPPPFANGGI